MGQKYKIFINGKVLYLTDNPACVDDILMSGNQFIIQPFKDKKNLKALLAILTGNINRSNMVIYHKDLEKLLKEFTGMFTYIEAAGGVVRNDDGRYLLIHRKGAWDLPKGKVDEGESLEETALREVMEETGLRRLILGEPVSFVGLANKCTYHSYYEGGDLVLKASYWYYMTNDGDDRLIPQLEEDIDEAVWVDASEAGKYYRKMYPSIIDVLVSAGWKRP